MAGLITLSFSSSITIPCICPLKLIPSIWDLSKAEISSFVPSINPKNQSTGFCSDQPGLGKHIGSSFVTIFLISPFSSINKSLTEEVPKSAPMYNMLSLLFLIVKIGRCETLRPNYLSCKRYSFMAESHPQGD